MKKIIVRIFLVVAVLLVVGLAVLYFSLNGIVKKGVETEGPVLTKVPVTLGAAEILPFSGSGRLTKLFVGNPEGYKSPSAIEIGDIKVGVAPGSIFSDVIVVNEVNIQSPVITLEGSLSANNLTKILDNVNGTSAGGTNSPAAKETGSAKKFIVKDLVLDGAKVNLVLNLPALGNKTMTVTIPSLHLQNIGTAENGVTAGQLVQAIMKPLLESVTTSAMKAVTDLTGQVGELGKKGAEQIQKGAKSITDLFKH